MSYHAKMTDDGRLVFPRELALALGLQPGDELKIDLGDDGLRIDRMALLEQHLRKLMSKPHIAAAVDDFIESRREEARLEEEKWSRLGL